MLALALSALPFALPPSDAPVVEGELGAHLDEYLERLSGHGFSGAVIVTEGERTILAKGYGAANRETRVPFRVDTLLPLGSISKHFTAAAVLRLSDDDVLDLDTTLSDLFEHAEGDHAGITIRQLLTHTGGFPEASGETRGASNAEEYVERALRMPLAFAPGTEMGYSNVGYGVLASIVELVSGAPFETFLYEEVLAPAGMKDTGILDRDWPSDRLAHGYIDGRDVGALNASFARTPWGLVGAGGMQTTLFDMSRWNRALDEGSVLKPETVAAMTSAQVGGRDFGYGYGTGVMTENGRTHVGHNGSNDVFSADYRRYPEQGLMIFAAGNNADAYAMDVTPLLEEALFGAELEMPPAVVALPEGEVAAFAGEWKLESGAVIRVASAGPTLELSSADAEAGKLVHPLPNWQSPRRDELLASATEAFAAAFEGEFEPLHELVDPYSRFDGFVERTGGTMDDLVSENGDFQSVHAVPGLCRFGEIGIVVVLEFSEGRAMIEYSFGEDEVGSVRFLGEYPVHSVRPASDTSFASYDIGAGDVWEIEFEEADGAWTLLLRDGLGNAVRARR